MGNWYDSKRLLVFFVILLVAIKGFEGWMPVWDRELVVYGAIAYILGQSLVDFAKAWKGVGGAK